MVAIVKVSTQDAHLIRQIAGIEGLVQPLDSWNEQSIANLLGQDINDCWAVVETEQTNINSCDRQPVDDPLFVSKEIIVQLVDNTKIVANEDSHNVSHFETKVVAYCLCSSVFETAEILRIGTHPNYQRRGLAGRLLNMIIMQMPSQQLEKILLEVRQDNSGAIALYEKFGFKVIAIRKNYYTEVVNGRVVGKCDALIMQYVL